MQTWTFSSLSIWHIATHILMQHLSPIHKTLQCTPHQTKWETLQKNCIKHTKTKTGSWTSGDDAFAAHEILVFIIKQKHMFNSTISYSLLTVENKDLVCLWHELEDDHLLVFDEEHPSKAYEVAKMWQSNKYKTIKTIWKNFYSKCTTLYHAFATQNVQWTFHHSKYKVTTEKHIYIWKTIDHTYLGWVFWNKLRIAILQKLNETWHA